jgi:flavodoxin
MKTSKVNLIYFSPTGTSKKTLEAVAKGLGIKGVEHIDLTPPDAAGKSHAIPAGGLAVFAVPVYSGRVPPVAAQRLRTVKGNGTPAVLVAVYGNRAIEDALVELRDITTEQGFKAIASASFIGEHSFSTEATPIAPGRPDKEDLEKAKKFGEQVKAKLDGMAKPIEITVPGNRPYRERNPSGPRFPDTTVESCTLCGGLPHQVDNCLGQGRDYEGELHRLLGLRQGLPDGGEGLDERGGEEGDGVAPHRVQQA